MLLVLLLAVLAGCAYATEPASSDYTIPASKHNYANQTTGMQTSQPGVLPTSGTMEDSTDVASVAYLVSYRLVNGISVTSVTTVRKLCETYCVAVCNVYPASLNYDGQTLQLTSLAFGYQSLVGTIGQDDSWSLVGNNNGLQNYTFVAATDTPKSIAISMHADSVDSSC